MPTEEFGNADVEDIVRRVQQRLGKEVKVMVEPVQEIPRTRAGKFRMVISRVSDGQS
ncbi:MULTISPECIES: hypothetical protein [Anaerolinea]|uniref:hypothetical protein n=1 Tax=Anaerolinea TaxID=233189 RepID=UPI002614B591|nr:hypothetical protein [Anaerolinea thermophila]